MLEGQARAIERPLLVQVADRADVVREAPREVAATAEDESGQADEAGSDHVEAPAVETDLVEGRRPLVRHVRVGPEHGLARPGPGPRDHPVVAAGGLRRMLVEHRRGQARAGWVGSVGREDGRVGLSLAREDGRDESLVAEVAPQELGTGTHVRAAGELPAERHGTRHRVERGPGLPLGPQQRVLDRQPVAARPSGGLDAVGERLEEGSRLGVHAFELGGGQGREADRVGDAVELDAFAAEERGGRPSSLPSLEVELEEAVLGHRVPVTAEQVGVVGREDVRDAAPVAEDLRAVTGTCAWPAAIARSGSVRLPLGDVRLPLPEPLGPPGVEAVARPALVGTEARDGLAPPEPPQPLPVDRRRHRPPPICSDDPPHAPRPPSGISDTRSGARMSVP